MKILTFFFTRLVLFIVLILFSGLSNAFVPPDIELTAIFNYKETPISGRQKVTLMLYYSDDLEVPFYKEVIPNVLFDHGVGKIVVGSGGGLLNQFFDRPDIVVGISVLQNTITFPMNSVPYTIRTKESNKARRVDNEAIVKFLDGGPVSKQAFIKDGVINHTESEDIWFILKQKNILDGQSKVVPEIDIYDPALDLGLTVYNDAQRAYVLVILEQSQTKGRVGIHNEFPEVALDVNGVLTLATHRPSDVLSDGVMMFDSNQNQFLVYREGVGWESMSWMPDPEDISKWDRFGSAIRSDVSVGIGRIPNTVSLSVSKNVLVSQNVTLSGELNVFGSAMINGGYGFNLDGDLVVPSIELNSDNAWSSSGDLSFSGILYGQAGTALTGLSHFSAAVFDSEHFDSGVIQSNHLMNASIYPEHMELGIVSKENLLTGQVSAEYIATHSVTEAHINDGSIQTHHMMKNQISSNDIKEHVFLYEKYMDDALRSTHIVDGTISGSKIKPKHILKSHLVSTPFVTNAHIINHTLGPTHVELGSLLVSDFQGQLPISYGGTGQSSFINHGVLHSNNGQYASDPTRFSMMNGRMGIGGSPLADTLLTVHDEDDARLGILASDDSVSVLFENSDTRWDTQLKLDGSFHIRHDDQAVLSFSPSNKLGVGMENPTERLSLTGPIILGDSLSQPSQGCVSGSIRYSEGQFSLCIDSQWSSISPSSAFYRYFSPSEQSNISRSSVIFSTESDLVGDHLLVRSARESSVFGHALSLGGVDRSTISGAFSRVDGSQSSVVSALSSSVSILSDSHLALTASSVVLSDQLQGHFSNSMGVRMHQATVHSRHSNAYFLNRVNAQLDRTQTGFLRDSSLHSVDSDVSFVTDSTVRMNGGRGGFLASVDARIDSSEAWMVTDSMIDVRSSILHQVSSSRVQGSQHLIFGGDGHDISGDQHIGLLGRRHVGRGDRGVVIGDDVRVDHDDVVLLNTSSEPLTSDHHGQLKIQADGGLSIQFSPEFGISMTDSTMGWSHVSDAAMKTHKLDVDPAMVLRKVRELPVQYWQYKSQDNIQHIGPTAQDFYSLFQFGNSDKVIHSIDSDGVLLASVQGLHQVLHDLKRKLDDHQSLANIQSEQSRELNKTLTDVSKRLSVTEGAIQHHFRLLDQFESDHNDQNAMIAYIHQALFLGTWSYYLSGLQRPLGWLFVAGVGLALGGLYSVWVIRRRGRV